MNEGEPTACRDGLHLSCTFSKGTYDAFMYNFNRGQYGKPALSNRQAPFVQGQVGMWWWYFKWQWMRDALDQSPGMQNMLAAVFLVLGLFGGWVHYKRDRQSWWYFAGLMFTVTLCLIFYLNFKYGASQAPQLGEQRAARGPRPGLLLHLELLAVGRVGVARPDVRLGIGRRRCSAPSA